MRGPYTLVDLFSGGGGFSRGFQEAGFKPLVAVDNSPHAAKTYKANFGGALVLAEDIKDVSLALLRELAGVGAGEVDVVLASPPCEPFTAANPNRLEDPLDRLYRDPVGRLFLHAIRLVVELRPRVFLIENVPGVLDPAIRAAVRRELARGGYRPVYFNVLEAHRHGTPSFRRRVFVSNIRLAPAKTRAVTAGEALDGMPPPGPWPPNHEPPGGLTGRLKRRLPAAGPGEALITFRGSGGRYPNYIRIDPGRPAPTVMGSSRFIHPFEDRLLTVREQARLMGFPDTHVFLGGRDSQYDMVGEAVPPPLARAIALEVAGALGAGVA